MCIPFRDRYKLQVFMHSLHSFAFFSFSVPCAMCQSTMFHVLSTARRSVVMWYVLHARFEDLASSQHAFGRSCDDGGKTSSVFVGICSDYSDSNDGLIWPLPHRFRMSANEGITHASVREFLVKNNGKVKNIDLVHHFRQQLNDPVNKS